jgi:hypothetical protein
MFYGRLPDQNAFQNSDIPEARLFMVHHILEEKIRKSSMIHEINDNDEDDIIESDEERVQQQAMYAYFAKDKKIAEVNL